VEPVQKGLEIHREDGEPWLIGEDLVGLAGLRLLMGQQAEAREHLREAVGFLSRSESPVVLGTAVSSVAVLMKYEGNHVATGRLFGARSRITDEGGGVPPNFVLDFFGDPEAEARAALGDEAFERAHAEGYAMTMEQARAYAMELVQR